MAGSVFPHTEHLLDEERQKENWRKAERLIKELQAAVAGGGPPTGAAGGDLSGTYPNPSIGNNTITSGKIVDGTIVNGDINASAAIDATKVADGSVTSAEFQYINTLSSNAQTQIDGKAGLTSANTFTLAQLFAGGSAAAPGVGVGATNYGVYQTGTLIGLSTAGTSRLTTDSTRTAVAVIGTGAGSAGVPAHSYTTDSNTGMYRPGADQLGFACGGANSLFISTIVVAPLVPFALSLGGIQYSEAYLTSSYALVVTDPSFVPCDSSGGAITVTLPDQSTAYASGAEYTIVDATASAGTNNITIDAAGTATVQGAATTAITTNRGSKQYRYCLTTDDWLQV